ncbi:MAG TPA: isoprenylcysteine carboxylmethyltransferase family protein [Steroidobacteraceae bacterium]|nr:isoprenylcysteine carboxylmethyltransferase family protein [Steroidobacteraceae bacterium]
MKRWLALVYGVLAYAFFFCTFLYAIGFVGNVAVPRTIDTGPAAARPEAALVDLVLLSLFALQHSIMARRGFKRLWTRLVSWHIERSTFVIAASAVLALLLWQWRPLPAPVWDVRSTTLGTVLAVTFWLGWGVLLLSTFLIDHFELFGLRQVWAYGRGAEFHSPDFKTPALYRMVRHPIYLGFVIAFWSAPFMSVGHLLFSVATTGYILVGICFEERDLIAAYGQRYRQYRARVPMLIPLLKVRRGHEAPRESAKSGTTAG